MRKLDSPLETLVLEPEQGDLSRYKQHISFIQQLENELLYFKQKIPFWNIFFNAKKISLQIFQHIPQMSPAWDRSAKQ
jgi:hypothetical protein